MSCSARSDWFRLGCVLAALVPLGCTPNLEKNQQFADAMAHLERVDGDVKNTRIEVTKLTNEVGRLSTELATLKKGGVAGAAAVPADVLGGLTNRLNSLDVQVRTLSAALKAQPAAVAAPRAAAPEEAATPAPANRTRLAPASATSTPAPKGQMAIMVKGGRKGAAAAPRTGSATKKTTPSRRAETSAAASAPAGFYHQVTASDTLASIAGKYGVSTDAIIKANSLSASNPRIFSGSALYIPKKSAK